METILKIVFLFLIILFASCSNTRLLPPGEALYTGASVIIKDNISKKNKSVLQDDLTKLTRPKPNSKFLGMRLKLSFFNLAGDPNKKNFIRKFFRNIGEPPVLLSDLNLENILCSQDNFLALYYYFQDSGRLIKQEAHQYF